MIPWKLKSIAFSLIDATSSHYLLYLAQKHLTKRSAVRVSGVAQEWKLHRDVAKENNAKRLFEFGAGKNFSQNLFLSGFCEEQVVVDLNQMGDIGQIDEAAKQLSNILPNFRYFPIAGFDDLREHYKIEYIAPLDAADTPFDDDYFDQCISTNTLEHIPLESIRDIFKELKRIVRSDGTISARIDYSDHYAHTDKSIGMLNFLQFGEAEWSKHNHPSHFQNRLRHYDFVREFNDLGFAIELDRPNFDEVKLPGHISSDFDAENPTIAAVSGDFILRVP